MSRTSSPSRERDPVVGIGPLEISLSPALSGVAAAHSLCADLDAARSAGRRPVVGWPVGRTPAPIIAALVALARRNALDLSDITIVLMDDFVRLDGAGQSHLVDTGQGHSCRGTAVRDLVEPLNRVLAPDRRLSLESLWSPDPRDPGRYEAQIAAAGGIDTFLVALGGSDGHIALNPPMSAMDSRTRIVTIAASTRADNIGSFDAFTSIEDVPTHGITVGLATITDARHLIVAAYGPGKAGVLARLTSATTFDPAWPMTAMVGHPNVSGFCDRAAATDLAEVQR